MQPPVGRWRILERYAPPQMLGNRVPREFRSCENGVLPISTTHETSFHDPKCYVCTQHLPGYMTRGCFQTKKLVCSFFPFSFFFSVLLLFFFFCCCRQFLRALFPPSFFAVRYILIWSRSNDRIGQQVFERATASR